MRKILFIIALALTVGVHAQTSFAPTSTLDSVDVYSADSLTAYCRVANGGDTTTYGIFEVKDAGNVIVFVSDSILFDTIAGLFNYSFVFDSTDLEGDMAHTMRLMVYNAIGGDTTLPRTFTTPLDPGPPVVISIDTSDVSIDSANIVVHTSTADSADLILRWGYQANSPYIGQLTASVINAGGTTFALSGLLPDTTIYLYVEILNASGIDVKLASFTTLPPINSTVTTLSATSTGLTSGVVECEVALGTFIDSADLEVQVWNVDSAVWETSVSGPGVDSNGIYQVVIPAIPGTEYECECFISTSTESNLAGGTKLFTADPIVLPSVVIVGELIVTDSSISVFAIGDAGTAVSGDMAAYVNASLYNVSNVPSGDSLIIDIPNLTSATAYDICFDYTTTYGTSAQMCTTVMTNPPPPAVIQFELAATHLGGGLVMLIHSADYATVINCEITAPGNGCNTTQDSVIVIERGYNDTSYIQLSGLGELRLEANLLDSLGNDLETEVRDIDLGSSLADFVISVNLSPGDVFFQNGNIVFDIDYPLATQVYYLVVELADADYNIIGYAIIEYQEIIEFDSQNMSVEIKNNLLGAMYIRVVANTANGPGPCGENEGISDWELIPSDPNGPTTGVEEVIKETDYRLYPNPLINGQGTIELNQSGELIVLNSVGNTVYQQSLTAGNSSLDIGFLPNGLYFAKIQTEAGVIVNRITLQ